LSYFHCVIFNHDYTSQDQEAWFRPGCTRVVRVATATVFARCRRAAAARAYVRTVGKARARFLRDLNAPAIVIEIESRWRTLARGLQRAHIWPGDCLFVWDNQVEAFYVRVVRLQSMPASAVRRQAFRRRLLRSLRSASLN
jgi:hypothetical protein